MTRLIFTRHDVLLKNWRCVAFVNVHKAAALEAICSTGGN